MINWNKLAFSQQIISEGIRLSLSDSEHEKIMYYIFINSDFLHKPAAIGGQKFQPKNVAAFDAAFSNQENGAIFCFWKDLNPFLM